LGQKVEDLQDPLSRREERATTDAFLKIEIWRIESGDLEVPRVLLFGIYQIGIPAKRRRPKLASPVAGGPWLIPGQAGAHGGFLKTGLWQIGL
jgi:hypothetical protein